TVAFSHEGGGAYAVWARDVDGKRRGLVVNGTGDTEGVWPLDFAGKVAGLDVEADGAWTVAIRPLGPTPELSGGASGDESAVLYVGGSAVALRATVSHRGDGNVVVTAYDERGLRDLLVNDIGQYVGDVVVPAGTVAVAVHANGPWAVRTR
ncbi:MAG TPA: hypothetical protein VFT95_20690, partial [Micromonosporaceae bacterium]|nr:hypothetical protein [Micromonosporaceae bacterium]